MVKVWYADVNSCLFNGLNLEDFCESRKAYINSINNVTLKNQSLLVWKLLLFAFNQLGYDTKDMIFERADNGKWFVKNIDINFSLSHSHNIVAVVISTDGDVAIDVEKCSDKILKVEKLFVIDKKLDFKEKIKVLSKLWTEKECLLKSKNSRFFYGEYITDSFGEDYNLSISSVKPLNYKIEISLVKST